MQYTEPVLFSSPKLAFRQGSSSCSSSAFAWTESRYAFLAELRNKAQEWRKWQEWSGTAVTNRRCLSRIHFYPFKIDVRVSLHLRMSYTAFSLHLAEVSVLQVVFSATQLTGRQFLAQSCLECAAQAHIHFSTRRSWCKAAQGNYRCRHKGFLSKFVWRVSTAFLTLKIATVLFLYMTFRAWFFLYWYDYCLLMRSVARIARRHSACMSLHQRCFLHNTWQSPLLFWESL